MKRVSAVLAAAAVVAVVALVALFVVRPWQSGGDTQQAIDEPLPSPVAEAVPEVTDQTQTPSLEQTPEATSSSEADATNAPKKPAKPAPEPTKAPEPAVTELAEGRFEDAEYVTTGTARVVELADGRRFLRIEGFSTSQAPVIQVAFSEAPSGGEWGSYDDVRFASIGALKALSGNQNYEIPADLRLGGFTSVVIWCDKFDVALGTAPVQL